MPYLAVFLVAFLLALLTTPLAARLGQKWGLVDLPGGRRQHSGAVPRTGGWALFAPFLVAAGLAAFLGPRLPSPEGIDPNEVRRLAGILIGSTFVFAVGFWDDRRELKPRPQLLAQVAAGLIAVAGLLFIERVRDPFTDRLIVLPYALTVPLTVLWVMGMINTVNFLDGLDGLATCVTSVVALVLFVHMYRAGQYSVSLLPLALLGATLGFLPYNWYPARVFMGSTGSFFLGYALATVSVAGGPRLATMLLLLLVPIVDVGWLILLRTRRAGTFVHGDRRHLHFRLVDLGFSQRQVVLAYAGLSAAFGVVALVVASRLLKLGALMALGGALAFALAAVARRSEPQ
ncbi:MAG TPA: MraY family glycosyltransferase [Anaerolineae bacterium]|nr:MraY family glycosyltransferase [Anaerolineae bacterium]HNT06154.1 MraY family glycosyltransferase [Anaerolineae bacterium]HOU23782.1 MraY family glycosyltransferase [Anaerolineae bacterium]HQJ50743.1 MraY family glycosyltransferase [Anaerolineae bacterium]